MSTDVSGSPSIATIIAPIPIAAPAIIGRPGRWESAMPPAAPMNMLGKMGPPRKLLSERLYARPLQRTTIRSAPTVQPAAPSIRPGS